MGPDHLLSRDRDETPLLPHPHHPCARLYQDRVANLLSYQGASRVDGKLYQNAAEELDCPGKDSLSGGRGDLGYEGSKKALRRYDPTSSRIAEEPRLRQIFGQGHHHHVRDLPNRKGYLGVPLVPLVRDEEPGGLDVGAR